MGRTQYGRKIKKTCRAESDWIVMEGSQWGKAKEKLLAEHRFGIHGGNIEAFGISVAEMIKAGCITFAPNGGGQIEIINHPLLLYEDVQEAVEKIDKVLRNNKLQKLLITHLNKQGKKFSVGEFLQGISSAVKKLLGQVKNPE
jgi:glycosyltransferase involved in cell wall biosynthesis